MLNFYPLVFKNIPNIDTQTIKSELYKDIRLSKIGISKIVISHPYCAILSHNMKNNNIPYGLNSGIFINGVELERVNLLRF